MVTPPKSAPVMFFAFPADFNSLTAEQQREWAEREAKVLIATLKPERA